MSDFTDYATYKRDTLAAISGIGRMIVGTQGVTTRMSFAQRKKIAAPPFITDERWQNRLIGDKLVEISYGWMMGSPIIGVTVFHLYGEDSSRADMDHKASEPVFSIVELVEKLEALKATSDPTSKYHEA